MQTLKMTAEPTRLRVVAPTGRPQVDRKARTIRDYIAAEEGAFKTPGRGRFTPEGLRLIIEAWPSNGLRSHMQHGTLSDDGFSKFIGRSYDPWIDKVWRRDAVGRSVQHEAVKATLRLADSAFDKNPNGNLGEYILTRAEEDGDSFGTSLVLRPRKEHELDSRGRPRRDANGEEMPPMWFVEPGKLYASDVVDQGDATSSFLSADAIDRLPDAIVRRGAELLDRQFAGQPDNVIKARCGAWLDRYLRTRGSGGDRDVDGQKTLAEHQAWLAEALARQAKDKLDQVRKRNAEIGAWLAESRRQTMTASGFAVPYHREAWLNKQRTWEDIQYVAWQGRNVLCLIDHDPTRQLAQTSDGTLQLREAYEGLYAVVTLPNNALGYRTAIDIERHKIKGFSPWLGDRKVIGTPRCRPGFYPLEVVTATLTEVSLATSPTYTTTSVKCERKVSYV